MSNIKVYPQEGSRAYGALKSFRLAGGCGELSDWKSACQRSGSIREDHQITDLLRLLDLELMDVDDDMYAITPRGLAFIRVDVAVVVVDAPAVVAPVRAAPRTPPPDRPLAHKHMVRMPLTREGAHDYASIPSRMGNQSVPHLAAGTLIGGEKR